MQPVIIQISCIDQPGIVAKITGALFEFGGNVITLEQHVEKTEGSSLFFMRIQVDLPVDKRSGALEKLDNLGIALGAKITWRDIHAPINVGILVSKEPHCLIDIIARKEAGELKCNIPIIISNRPTLETLVSRYNIPFHYLPTQKQDTKSQEQQMKQLLKSSGIDLVVLARYMKILSEDFVNSYPEKIINIHHSFLPAFKGAKPYSQAWNRGVKIIGATAHYATPNLDEGPIIAQDVHHVSHYDSIKSLTESGREVEQRVLAEAVKAWLEYRIITHDRRTIIFH